MTFTSSDTRLEEMMAGGESCTEESTRASDRVCKFLHAPTKDRAAMLGTNDREARVIVCHESKGFEQV